jgi:hypothetical protein
LQRIENGRPLVQFVHIPPRRRAKRRSGKSPHFSQLVAAAEGIVIALIAARRD